MNYSIWVTTHCNLRCTYCYEGDEKVGLVLEKEMADKIICYIIKKESESREKEVDITYHGGEPFLNFAMIKYVTLVLREKIRNKKFHFSVTTNGTIMDKLLLKFIDENHFEISFSIDGDQKTHDLYRRTPTGIGTHAVVTKHIKEYLTLLPKARARMTYNEETVSDLADNIYYLIKLGFKYIVPIQDFNSKKWNEEHSKILQTQIVKAKSFVKRHSVDIAICEALDVSRKKVCNGGTTSINIYPDGTLYPCMIGTGISEYEIGDVTMGINSRKLNIILDKSNETIEECKGCSFYAFCENNRCRIINKVLRGNYCTPSDVVCSINNVCYNINGTSD